MQRQAGQGAELPDPLTRLSCRRTGAGCSSTLTLERAVGGSVPVCGSILGPLRGKTGDVIWDIRNLAVPVSAVEMWLQKQSVHPLRTWGSASADLEVMGGGVKGCETCTGLASPIFVQHRVCAEFTEIQTWIVLEQLPSCRGLTMNSSLLCPVFIKLGVFNAEQ